MHGDFVKLDGAKRKFLQMRLSVWFPPRVVRDPVNWFRRDTTGTPNEGEEM